MITKETIRRNITLTFDFVRHLTRNPSEIGKLPAKSEVVFIEKDFTAVESATRVSSGRKKKYYGVEKTFAPMG